ncbi:hypothetical protein QUF74_07490 [Candidatus Halobeggiatoa sp. HSG11]|nr:hypothetical protein [Candidatus Halobeggiatoa sp. HSG11]
MIKKYFEKYAENQQVGKIKIVERRSFSLYVIDFKQCAENQQVGAENQQVG